MLDARLPCGPQALSFIPGALILGMAYGWALIYLSVIGVLSGFGRMLELIDWFRDDLACWRSGFF